MSLLEQFRPTSTAQLIGNPLAIKKLCKSIKENKPCLLFGPPGVGKTSAVFAYAKEHNYKVEELNASDQRKKEDLQPLIRRVQCSLFFPTIFLLDEVDGAEHFTSIEDCIKYTRHPLVLICNDVHKIPQKIKDITEQIQFRHPYTSDVSKLIEKISLATGRRANYSNISGDVRNSILCAFFNGNKYTTEDDFKIVSDFFKKSNPSKLEEKHLVWLLDNATENFKGKKLYDFIQLLEFTSRTTRFDSLCLTPTGKGIATYPRYFQRSKVLKSKNKGKSDNNESV